MPKKRPIPDPVEEVIRLALHYAGIPFEQEPDGLDFYLPTMKVHIECKAYYTPRVTKQLSGTKNVILIQGLKSAFAFAAMLQGMTFTDKDAAE